MLIVMNEKVKKLVEQFEDVLSTFFESPIKLIVTSANSNVSERLIRELVCSTFKVQWYHITSSSREKDIVSARQCYCYLVKHYFKNLSVTQIGKSINKDHSTVVCSIRIVKDYIKTGDEYICSNLELINNAIIKSDKTNDETKAIQKETAPSNS